jgi:hypothetical protein
LANAGLWYNNQKTQDSLDFVFLAYSWGLSFWASADNQNVKIHEPNGVPFTVFDPNSLHMWEFDMYRHSGVRFLTQQDRRIEANSAMIPAGMGAIGNSVGHDLDAENPMLHHIGGSGVPSIKNRWQFDKPIALPRTATIEGELEMSPYARYLLGLMNGPLGMDLPGVGGIAGIEFPHRVGVTMSLVGKRLVQQRGEYHI